MKWFKKIDRFLMRYARNINLEVIYLMSRIVIGFCGCVYWLEDWEREPSIWNMVKLTLIAFFFAYGVASFYVNIKKGGVANILNRLKDK